MRREVLAVALIAAAAFGDPLYPAWNGVFGGPTDVNFLETDAWYHVRLVENQVRNFPWRVTARSVCRARRPVRRRSRRSTTR